MTALSELEALFIRREVRTGTWRRCGEDHVHSETCGESVTGPQVYEIEVETLAEAQGVRFLCPKCFATNGGAVGTHSVVCWSRSRGIPDDAEPSPGRWTMEGTGLGDLTLNGDPPGNPRSVLLTGGGCGWHGFVTNGDAT